MDRRMDLRQEQECAPTFADRLIHVVGQWDTSLTFFCMVFGFFLGLAFVLHPLTPAANIGAYVVFGTRGLLALGLVYMALTAYTMLYPERNAQYMTIAVVAGTGLYVALHPPSVVGIVFWSLALATVALGVWRRLRALRKEARE